jgi:hypothetical protein
MKLNIVVFNISMPFALSKHAFALLLHSSSTLETYPLISGNFVSSTVMWDEFLMEKFGAYHMPHNPTHTIICVAHLFICWSTLRVFFVSFNFTISLPIFNYGFL